MASFIKELFTTDKWNIKNLGEPYFPYWVDRETFFKEKENSAYIKYIWSFGTGGTTYMYGRDIEQLKKSASDWVVLNHKDETMEKILPGVQLLKSGITERRHEFYGHLKKEKLRCDLECLERIDRLESLERLQQLERIINSNVLSNEKDEYKKIEFFNLSYEAVELKKGDVIYLDPPYELDVNNKPQKYYGCEDFDFKKLYEWIKNCPYPCFMSSYNITDNDLICILENEQKTTMSGTDKSVVATEKIYCNQVGYDMIKQTLKNDIITNKKQVIFDEEYNLFNM